MLPTDQVYKTFNCLNCLDSEEIQCSECVGITQLIRISLLNSLNASKDRTEII